MTQPGETSSKKVRALLCERARACLTALREAEHTPQPAAALHAAAGWTVLLLVFPTPVGDDEPGLTACDRDCLGLLAQAKEPLSGVRVRAELERRGIAVYGEVTVKRSLAKLRRRGVVSNSRMAPRGYYLPETLPLSRGLESL
jgi:hypothetical protein